MYGTRYGLQRHFLAVRSIDIAEVDFVSLEYDSVSDRNPPDKKTILKNYQKYQDTETNLSATRAIRASKKRACPLFLAMGYLKNKVFATPPQNIVPLRPSLKIIDEFNVVLHS